MSTVRTWVCGTLAVGVEFVDFLDPALVGEADVRERGVRLELRPVRQATDGSIYASPALALEPAVCRIDLLESRPGAADRMHWHPRMGDGEPGDRTFDRDIPADPLGWLAGRLDDVSGLLEQAGVLDPTSYADAAAEVAEVAPEILERVRRGLELAREPWPDVTHDERGMAPVRPVPA